MGMFSARAASPALVLCSALWGLIACAAHAAEKPDELSGLSERHRAFLTDYEALISKEERQVFLQLNEAHWRDAFIQRFWQIRDPYPETGRNELRDRLEENTAAIKDLLDDAEHDDRARVVLLLGEPAREQRNHCDKVRPLLLWSYSAENPVRHELWAVFQRLGGGWQLWSPRDGVRSILTFSTALTDPEAVLQIQQYCSQADLLITALSLSPDWVELEKQLLPHPNPEWAQAFLDRSTELPADAAVTEVTLSVDYVGRHQSRTVVQALAAIPGADLETSPLKGRDVARLLVDGEVLQGEELFDTFRYRFDLPVNPQAGWTAPVVVERFLRPGVYRLALKVQDLTSERYFVSSSELDVPRWTPRDDGESQRSARLEDATLGLAASDADALARPSRPVVRLKVPTDALITGNVRVEAEVEGEGIERVAFELNGKPVLTKGTPPYSVELDIGDAPRTHQLAAIALNAAGEPVARDEVTVNSGPHRFAIRLVEPQRGKKYRGLVRAAAEVDVPRLERLDHVEIFLNDTLVATLFQPPFVQTIMLPEDLDLGYVRAVGVLANGTQTEDVVFVNAPDEIEHMDVNFVELYTTVLDRRGRPVEDLTADELEVVEDGERQQIRRFERVKDLSIYAGILLDTSTSMETRLDDAEEAALAFFSKVLTSKDHACLMTFADSHQLVVPFTNKLEVLAGGLSGLIAEGETSLYDSLLKALFYFSGLTGKRALVLLTDGEDSISHYRFDDVLDFARRSGVTIYAIGLSIDQRKIEARSSLNRLCHETGGACYYIENAKDLRAVYERIETDLHSQYLIAYQSSSTKDAFRTVAVNVKRPGLRARTMAGYYP